MPEKKDKKPTEVPMSLRLRPEVRAKLEEIATANDVSLVYVAVLAIANGLPTVEAKLKTLRPASALVP